MPQVRVLLGAQGGHSPSLTLRHEEGKNEQHEDRSHGTSLLQHYAYYGDAFTIECPMGSGKRMTLFEVTMEIANRLIRTFTRGADGRRPVYGGADVFQRDQHWRDLILFYEYFHGDNGAGLGILRDGLGVLTAPYLGVSRRGADRTAAGGRR